MGICSGANLVLTFLRGFPASAPSCTINIRHVIAKTTTVRLRNSLAPMLRRTVNCLPAAYRQKLEGRRNRKFIHITAVVYSVTFRA
jgi:hypothetical protein